MAHPLKSYARHVQRNGEGEPSYQGALSFVEDTIGFARRFADADGKGEPVRDVLVRLWDSEEWKNKRGER